MRKIVYIFARDALVPLGRESMEGVAAIKAGMMMIEPAGFGLLAEFRLEIEARRNMEQV